MAIELAGRHAAAPPQPGPTIRDARFERVKICHVPLPWIVAFLTADGTQVLKMSGFPDGAVILAWQALPLHLQLIVHHPSFPVVLARPGAQAPDLIVTAEVFSLPEDTELTRVVAPEGEALE